ncbi:Serine/threonine-protein kinase PrkC [Gimesia panareensis]|uniref:non-specific serine/threonine protein kinase n=1 Tax=Gimesia panareensis TaxID=2527978 RepID=A0A517Q9S3_9PLAN|nr:protein kinase [Gimesia panareensis]QDT28379.1 Serine/threonine-protein kinase PrkC [Gimesia panareensis]
MHHKLTACNPDSIELFLQQKLSDSEQADFERHLDDCSECRAQLETAAASDEIWSSVRESLQDETRLLDEPLAEESAWDTATGPAASFSQSSILNLLAPSDDERMLGRLGTYEVVGVIGAGGMGIVLKALDPALNRYVAIKILAPHLGSSGAARQRFSREAQAAAAVVHDSVIEIHGVAETKGLPYLVMSYVRGQSLQRRIDDSGPLALVEILRIGMQAANGLAAAHAQGLVHRDVKPANILLADGVERVKLTDFGLARAADDASLTRTGIIAGTPQYMSPEQARGEAVDQASDLFSLGSVLYTLCTGRAPFRSETSYGVLRRITDEEPRPIREINPEIPEWLCQIIGRLMSKEPAERYASASEVSALLEECLAHVQRPTEVALPETLAVATRPRRVFRVVTLVAALSAVVLGFCFWLGTAPPDIAGKWRSPEWGIVTLNHEEEGDYTGSYQQPGNAAPGSVRLKWSRIERRFNGIWREGEARFGKLSIRLVDDEIRGAWTTSRQSRVNPGTPEMADLLWVRVSADKAAQPVIDVPESMLLKGQVVSVAEGEAVLSLGKQLGIKVGMQLAVIDQGKICGRVFITKVEQERSVGRIFEEKKETPVQPGQLVIYLKTGVPVPLVPQSAPAPTPLTAGTSNALRQIHPDFFGSREESIKVRPKTAAEKAIAQLTLISFQNQTHRAVRGIMVNAGAETYVITAGLGPEAKPPIAARMYLDIPGRGKIGLEYQKESTKDLYLYRARRKLTDYRPVDDIQLEIGDQLSAILLGGTSELYVTPHATRITTLRYKTKTDAAGKKKESPQLVEFGIDRNLPSGIPLFKDGKLVGITRSRPRYVNDNPQGTFVVPVGEMVELCDRLKSIPESSSTLVRPASEESVSSSPYGVPPKTAAEKAIARLVLVFFRDQSRRAIPGILVNVGSQTCVVTAGTAGIVPEGAPAAVDRMFLEFPNRPPIEAVYQPQSTKELFVYRTQQKLTDYQPSEYVLLAVGDELSAMYPGSSPQFTMTPQAARIVALNCQAELSLPHLKKKHRYEGLIQLDRSLPEGTPLFKEGQLAGLTLVGTRFLGENANKSYMLPISRIAAFCRDLKFDPAGRAKPDPSSRVKTDPAGSRQLSDVVQEFNQQQQLDPVGKGQPLLTDDEVVASVRWALLEKKIPGLSAEQLQQFREIAELRRFAAGWRLEFKNALDGEDQDRFQAWQVQLVLDQPQGPPFIHVIRTRLLNQQDAAGQPVKLSKPGPLLPDNTPLAAAIHGFNSAHRSLGGIDQPPLTEEEVVAAIRRMKTRRNELDVTNAEFAALQKIADQRQLPEDVGFELLNLFQPGDGNEYLIWSIRLTLPRISNRVPYPRYTIILRKQYVRSQAIDNGKIAWGPVAENGLQAGVRFEPHKEQYATGQQVLPRFYYRNTGDQFVEISLPRLMTHSYYTKLSAVDDTGKPIPIDQDRKPAGPVGWWVLPFGFGVQHEIRGLPIRLGDMERGQAETVIQAKPGQSVRVRFTLPNYADNNAPPLKTGEIRFSMAEPEKELDAVSETQE